MELFELEIIFGGDPPIRLARFGKLRVTSGLFC